MTKMISAKSFASAAFAVATMATAMTASADAAQAKWGHKGAFFGSLGAGLAIGLVGAAIANQNAVDNAAYTEDDDAFRYRRVCRMEPHYNDFGEFIGRVRVCRTGY